MLHIGEFAGITGLTVKALRHYDEKGILVPAEIDDLTGYRLYSAAQVRTGAMIRSLRAANVPVSRLTETTTPTQAAETLSRWRQEVIEQRRLEDSAFSDASEQLRLLDVPVHVSERTLPEQPFVAQRLPLAVNEDMDSANEQANTALMELYERLQAAGNPPVGNFWITLKPTTNGDLEVWCCWPTTQQVAEGHLKQDEKSDRLPARTELVAEWASPSDANLPEHALDPATAALCDALAGEEHHLRKLEIRQSITHSEHDESVVSVAVTIAI